MDQLSLPLGAANGQRRRIEALLCAEIEAELQDRGLRVEREYPTKTGRVDIAVLHPEHGYAVEFIEAKVVQPLAGVGQLLGYRYGLLFAPSLTLVVPPSLHGQPALAYACETAGIRLWEYEPADRRRRQERFRDSEAVRAQQQAAALADRRGRITGRDVADFWARRGGGNTRS